MSRDATGGVVPQFSTTDEPLSAFQSLCTGNGLIQRSLTECSHDGATVQLLALSRDAHRLSQLPDMPASVASDMLSIRTSAGVCD